MPHRRCQIFDDVNINQALRFPPTVCSSGDHFFVPSSMWHSSSWQTPFDPPLRLDRGLVQPRESVLCGKALMWLIRSVFIVGYGKRALTSSTATIIIPDHVVTVQRLPLCPVVANGFGTAICVGCRRFPLHPLPLPPCFRQRAAGFGCGS